MGIIYPKELSTVSKILITILVIGLLPVMIIVVILYLLWGAILYLAIWLTWPKQFVVFVYSDSPTWKDYIEREIIPYFQDRVVILNWSQRKRWRNSLAILAFRYFGGYRNFNPMAMVFHSFRFVKTYRFFGAFKDFKHGDLRKVEELRARLLADIGN